jgi:S-adenosylmethionine-diacylglycerol 3-amino-3-carboxypropyl transferase
LPEVLQPHEELARMLHPRDRVHTYGSFHIADLCV